MAWQFRQGIQRTRDLALPLPSTCFFSSRIGPKNRFHVKCVARALSTFPGQHHPVPYGQADRVKASLTRSTDEIERFQRESFPFPGEHHSITYC